MYIDIILVSSWSFLIAFTVFALLTVLMSLIMSYTAHLTVCERLESSLR